MRVVSFLEETLKHSQREMGHLNLRVINLSGMSTRDPAASHPVPLSDKPL